MTGFNASAWALTHKSFIGFLMVMSLLAGLLAYGELGRDEDPPFTIKVMIVRAFWPGATADETARQLTAYFEGSLRDFDVPLAPEGSDFQRQVWDELVKIPFGQTISYLTLAKRIGDARHVRAVGTANGRNPISIIIPCHRVVGSDASLVGYGGGLERKRWLLDHETRVAGILLT